MSTPHFTARHHNWADFLDGFFRMGWLYYQQYPAEAGYPSHVYGPGPEAQRHATLLRQLQQLEKEQSKHANEQQRLELRKVKVVQRVFAPSARCWSESSLCSDFSARARSRLVSRVSRSVVGP